MGCSECDRRKKLRGMKAFQDIDVALINSIHTAHQIYKQFPDTILKRYTSLLSSIIRYQIDLDIDKLLPSSFIPMPLSEAMCLCSLNYLVIEWITVCACSLKSTERPSKEQLIQILFSKDSVNYLRFTPVIQHYIYMRDYVKSKKGTPVTGSKTMTGKMVPAVNVR